MATSGFSRRATSEHSPDDADARAHIVECAWSLIGELGWESAGSAQVARAAGVSKALIHYHFGDKTSLLAAAGDRCRVRIEHRAELASSAIATRANPVDDFAEWFEAEINAGDLRVVQQLAVAPQISVRRETGRARDAYRVALAHQVRSVFNRLELEPKIAEHTIVDLFETIGTGMATGAPRSRQMVEAAWLALLTLAD